MPDSLEGDYHALGGADRDKFELHLRNVLNKNFGAAFVTSKLNIIFPSIGEIEICQIDIQQSREPIIVSVKDKNGQVHEKFYARSGNSSQEISMSEMKSYLAERFQG